MNLDSNLEKDEKQLSLLMSTFKMHLKQREATILRGKKDTTEKMDAIIKDDINKIGAIDPEFANKCIAMIAEEDKKGDNDLIQKINEPSDMTVFDELEKMDVMNETFETINQPTPKEPTTFFDEVSEEDVNLYAIADKIEGSFEQSAEVVSNEMESYETIHNNADPLAQYDLIPLPSKGECYKMKFDKVPVGYLTAADENLITSPNLYESGSISSVLLKKKILNKDIDVDNLVAGDADAIMLFLRGTSYGSDFPITATDPKTGKKIEAMVDLSSLKYKPFSLSGDENGFFDFRLPKTKAQIKFKFLTKREERLLQKLNKKENQGIGSFDLNEAIDKIKSTLKNDDSLSDGEKNGIIDMTKKLEAWTTKLNKKGNNLPYTKSVTNTMEMQIVSVNGNNDRKFIHNFVMNMPASDSLAFRRYVYDNQPGVDFEVEVNRPESMGGGSFKCFLEWDDTIFWNIA